MLCPLYPYSLFSRYILPLCLYLLLSLLSTCMSSTFSISLVYGSLFLASRSSPGSHRCVAYENLIIIIICCPAIILELLQGSILRFYCLPLFYFMMGKFCYISVQGTQLCDIIESIPQGQWINYRSMVRLVGNSSTASGSSHPGGRQARAITRASEPLFRSHHYWFHIDASHINTHSSYNIFLISCCV